MALLGVSATLALVWVWPLPALAHDLFAAHMVQHLVSMNVAALLLGTTLPPIALYGGRPLLTLPIASALQMAALWIWHMPAVFSAVHHAIDLQALMHLSLFAAALLFWKGVLQQRGKAIGHSIFALLITAKIYCMLGAALVFSRRPLYPQFGDPDGWGLTHLEDQQLAGLIMVSSCALIYVAAAILLFARWLFTPEERAIVQ
jgi:putative membrane protein